MHPVTKDTLCRCPASAARAWCLRTRGPSLTVRVFGVQASHHRARRLVRAEAATVYAAGMSYAGISIAFTTATRCMASAPLSTTCISCSPSPPVSVSARPPPLPIAAATSSPTDPTAELPVSPQLLTHVTTLMHGHEPQKWMAVSNLYADLPPQMRRLYVRPHKSMLHVLQKCKTQLGISINSTGTMYAVGSMPEEPPPRPASSPRTPMSGGATASVSAAAGSSPGSASGPPSATQLVGFAEPHFPALDFYYDVQLKSFPDPPADFNMTPASVPSLTMHSSADGAVIALRDFVAYIPPFFVPLQDVLAHMPGYTAEHVEKYLSKATTELVTVAGQRFIRLHSGYEKLSLAGCEPAEELHQQYRPPPALVDAFVDAFAGVTDKWMPLQELLRRADPAAVAQLPFQGPAAVTYFAQMQHRFAFAVRTVGDDGGGNSSSPSATTTEAAVLLRRDDYGGLECGTTPTPKSLSCLFALVPAEGQVEVADVARQLPAAVKEELDAYYGGLTGFFAKHRPIFFVPPDTPSIVMRTRYRSRMHVASRPLEEQLQYAKQFGKKAKIRIIRRRIACRDNPSHPLLDPENLAKELNTYLPRRGFVSLRVFLKRAVPEEVLVFMPPKMRSFFNAYPQFFAQFEYQQAGNWCVCRPDQPLPRGVIRQAFSEADTVRVIAEVLQKRGPRAVSGILLNLPRGAQELVKKKYGGLYHFVVRYPQYFNVVLSSDNSNAHSSGVIHLIQVPSRELDEPGVQVTPGVFTNRRPAAALIEGREDRENDNGDGEDAEDDEYDGLD